MILQTEVLSSSFNKANFNCGNELLTAYLHTKAGQDIKNKLAQTFVLPDGKNVMGYYSLAASSISRKLVPEKLLKKVGKYSDFPVTLLGRLAVDQKYQKQGIGKVLLIDALIRSYLASKMVASFAVIVDPIDENAVKLYSKYDFIELDNGRMFLPMGTFESLFTTLQPD